MVNNYAKVHGVKRTRRNQVVRLVREHYLREDIANPLRLAHFHGSEQKGSAGKPKEEVYVTLDASCLPYQVDVLERGAEEGAITGVVLYSSVVEAVRRLRGESAKRRVLDLLLSIINCAVALWRSQVPGAQLLKRLGNLIM